MMPLDHPLALVTGGGRGIGQGICLALAEANFAVAVNYRASREGAARTAEDCRRRGAPWSEIFAADVAESAQRTQLVEDVLLRTGRIDVLVNNAGISSPVRGDLLEVTPENWDTVLNTNLSGPYFLTQQVARQMIRLRAEGVVPRPVIVNISSVSAYIASTARAEYCISKAGLAMMTQLYAHRLAPEGILVYEIRPGIIRSDMTRAAEAKYDALIEAGLTPIRRWGTPEDVGKAVVAVARGQFSFSTGEIINVDGGMHSRHL
jgi:NAD(P)-dependent dehydrogenase (short-subunit alcohol dehydrogenase family)